MKHFRLATWTTLAGLVLAAGCASPCGPFWQRSGFFRPRAACPCEGGVGVPVTGDGSFVGDAGPYLTDPGAVGPPAPLPPNLGAPSGPPVTPVPDGRLQPIPNSAQPLPANPSSRSRR